MLRSEILPKIDETVLRTISLGNIPGAVIWLECKGDKYHQAYGNRCLEPSQEAMTRDVIFDAASLTKVIATTPAVMLLIEKGLIKLDYPVNWYLPEFIGHQKELITVRQLLTHSSGLNAGISVRGTWQGREGARRRVCLERPLNPPDQAYRYSDINFILLGLLVERVAYQPLEKFCWEQVYQPLKMEDTGFLPPVSKRWRIAPTQWIESQVMLEGVVHDPTSRKMGGVAGHAGLFTTASDLAKFARAIIQRNGFVLKPETITLMSKVHSPKGLARRTLGWDYDSPYAGQRGYVYPVRGIGHTGWTGTSIWIDAPSESFIISLSNRNHPNGKGNSLRMQRHLGTLAAIASGLGSLDDLNRYRLDESP